MAAARQSQESVELLLVGSDDEARITQQAVELLFPYVAPSPASPTGAGISQQAVELLVSASDDQTKVSQDAVEVLYSDASPLPQTEAGTRASGGVA